MKRLMNVVALSFFILSVSLASFGCAQTDDEGGPGASSDAGIERDMLDSTPPTPDTVSEADTSIEPDLSEPDVVEEPDVQQEPDLPPPVCGGLGEPCCDGFDCDEGLTCGSGSLCVVESGCPDDPACFDAPDVGDYPGALPILMREGAPPTLSGGTIVDGDYELTLIEMYAENEDDPTFSELVTTVEVSDNGTSYGSLAFLGPDWSFGAYLDLYIYIYVQLLDMEFPQDFQTALDAGGCYVATGNRLESDITECGGAWPEGSDPPSYLEYEASTDTVKFLLILTHETILAAIPEADRDMAAIAIVGDLPIVFNFNSID